MIQFSEYSIDSSNLSKKKYFFCTSNMGTKIHHIKGVHRQGGQGMRMTPL
jgi:hypothetical protein